MQTVTITVFLYTLNKYCRKITERNKTNDIRCTNKCVHDISATNPKKEGLVYLEATIVTKGKNKHSLDYSNYISKYCQKITIGIKEIN